MPPIRITMLGPGRVECGRDGEVRFPTANARDLFFYLVLRQGKRLARDQLVGLFFGELPEDAARKRFRMALWRMRKALEAVGVDPDALLVASTDAIGFEPSCECWVDVVAFTESLRSGREALPGDPERADRCFLEATDLYKGDLLEGVYYDWLAYDQQALKASLLETLELRMRLAASARRWTLAADLAHRLLDLDMLRESVHRDLMCFLYRAGNRPAALQQYANLVDILDEELGVGPMEETERLHRAIIDESDGSIREAAPEPIVTTRPPRGAPFPNAAFHAARLRAMARELVRVSQSLEEDRPRGPDRPGE